MTIRAQWSKDEVKILAITHDTGVCVVEYLDGDCEPLHFSELESDGVDEIQSAINAL